MSYELQHPTFPSVTETVKTKAETKAWVDAGWKLTGQADEDAAAAGPITKTDEKDNPESK